MAATVSIANARDDHFGKKAEERGHASFDADSWFEDDGELFRRQILQRIAWEGRPVEYDGCEGVASVCADRALRVLVLALVQPPPVGAHEEHTEAVVLGVDLR